VRVLLVADAASVHTKRWLDYFLSRGDEVHVASFSPISTSGVFPNVLATYGLGKIGYLSAIPTLRSIIRRVKPDITHAHYLTSYGFLAALAGARPLVVTAWGSDALISPRDSRLHRWIASYAVRHADRVTTLAGHMNGAVASLGVAESAIAVTPFGVDAKIFSRRSRVEERGYLTIVCTRNFHTVYDIATLLRAAALVLPRFPTARLDLIGTGPLEGDLRHLAKAICIAEKVRFLGHVEHSTLAQILQSADVFVSPSLSDGNNVSLNEAMACGCFPIATNIPANAQWIEHGKNGLLYRPSDDVALAEMLQLALTDSALRQSAEAINRDIVEKEIDWRVCTARMQQVYDGLMMEDVR